MDDAVRLAQVGIVVSDTYQVEIRKPKFSIGQRVIALINNQLREAHVEKAFLEGEIVVDDAGMRIEGSLRWEYLVLVIADPIESSEKMLITERTIIREMDTDEPDTRSA